MGKGVKNSTHFNSVTKPHAPYFRSKQKTSVMFCLCMYICKCNDYSDDIIKGKQMLLVVL